MQLANTVSAASANDETETPLLAAHAIGRQAEGRWLLKQVSLALPAGARMAIVGPSGSGKTLLLRALALLDPVESGEILWRGEPVRGGDVPRFRSRVIYLHQRPALIEGTVEENLRLPFSLGVHRDKTFDRDAIAGRLASLGREASLLSRQTGALSGGEAQITALLRAMQLEPEVLLLDEPTASLDDDSKRTVETMVDAWRDESPELRTTVWVTHDAGQVERIADQVFPMRDGALENP
ncbi:MAG: ATP-binding cassette domain-containing protein [Pirellulaceae bacterium]